MTPAATPLSPARGWRAEEREGSAAVELRRATTADAGAIHALVSGHVESDHLLPRTREEIEERAARFVVGTRGGAIVACAELAPLSADVAEVRSLVVAEDVRRMGVGRLVLDALVRQATAAGYERLSAFTHQPAYFIRLGFSIVPHLWVREKVFTDCVGCPLFRSCGQHAVVLPLAAGSAGRARPGVPARRERVA